MEGQGEAGLDKRAHTLQGEGLSARLSRAESACSVCRSTLAGPLPSPRCATTASQTDIMCRESAYTPGAEEGRNTLPRRGKSAGEELPLRPVGAGPPAWRAEDSGLGLDQWKDSGEELPVGAGAPAWRAEDSGLGLDQWKDSGDWLLEDPRGIPRGEEVLPEPGGRITHGKGRQEDTGRESIALEPDQCSAAGPALHPTRDQGRRPNGTEQQSPLLTPAASQGASPRNQSWMRKLLPPEEVYSSPWFRVPCVFVLLLCIVLAALLGHSSQQDVLVPHIPPCPMDWLHSRNKCYYFSMMYRKEGDWDESQSFCSSYNGSLALFDTQEELNFLMHICSRNHMWVGLQNSGSEIQWANGSACSSSLCKVPDSGECAYIQEDAIWVSGCDLKRSYICTKETYL